MSSSSEAPTTTAAENGDYIINWHLQYCASIFLQNETKLKDLGDMVKAELMKIKTDGDFIKNQLSGSHNNLLRLKNQDRDLRTILESINHLSDLFRTISRRSAQRII